MASGIVYGVEQDNLIINGTFDTDMNNWTNQTSINFTINAENGNCVINTTHTDWIVHHNVSDFQNPTSTINTEIIYETPHPAPSPSDLYGDGIISLSRNITSLIINPYFNESEGNWTYIESPTNESQHIKGNYNISYNNTYSIESKQKQNITDGDYAIGRIEQQINIPQLSQIEAITFVKHHNIGGNGTIESRMRVDGFMEVYYSGTSSDAWFKQGSGNPSLPVIIPAGDYTINLTAKHSIIEDDKNFTSKATYWDNCFVNTTTYNSSYGEYISEVIDRDYYANWLTAYIRISPFVYSYSQCCR